MGLRKRILLAAFCGSCFLAVGGSAALAQTAAAPSKPDAAKPDAAKADKAGKSSQAKKVEEKPKVSEARLAEIFSGKIPQTLDELRAMEKRQKELAKKVIRYTVGLQVGPAHGSGVIISKDGYILTAAHVAMQPGAPVIVTFPDGKRVRGRSLGMNKRNDAGMIKINETKDEEGNVVEWPHAEMGVASSLKRGQWCFAAGHPGGFNPTRNLVVRVGRILSIQPDVLVSDCPLIGGDSGGPLYDMNGDVIAIHSRIGQSLTSNLHVPVNAYADAWDRLANAESWGSRFGDRASKPTIGVGVNTGDENALIRSVSPGGPADKAGLKADDVVTHIADQPVSDSNDLIALIGKQKIGKAVTFKVKRDGKEMTIDIVIGRRR